MRQWLSIQEHFRRGNADSHLDCRAAAFSKSALRKLAGTALERGAEVLSDGLKCFAAVTEVGCKHTAIVTGSGPKAAKTPAFKWVNTALGNIKAALVGTYRRVISPSSNIGSNADMTSAK